MFTTKALTSTPAENEQGPKKVWKTRKDAPLTMDPKAANRQLWLSRQNARLNTEKDLNKKSTELRTEANQAMAIKKEYTQTVEDIQNAAERERKDRAKVEYLKRKTKREQAVALTNKSNHMAWNQRMRLFQKHHYCKHGMKHNLMREDTGIFSFMCDHDRSDEKRKVEEGMPCMACGFVSHTTFVNRYCHCLSYFCARCRRQTYHYEYNNTTVKQLYDKHVGSDNIVITLKNEDHVSLDFEKILEECTIRKIQVKPDDIHVSYASAAVAKREFSHNKDRKRFYSLVKKMEAEKKQELAKKKEMTEDDMREDEYQNQLLLEDTLGLIDTIPEVSTIPEGGTLSAMTSPVERGIGGIIQGILDMKDKITNQLREYISSFFGFPATGMVRYLVKMLKALLYVFGVLVDYIVAANPLLIYHAYKAFQQRAWGMFVMYLASIMSTLKTFENESRMRLHKHFQFYQVGDDIPIYLKDKPAFGALNTIFYSWIESRSKKVGLTHDILHDKIEAMGVFGNSNKFYNKKKRDDVEEDEPKEQGFFSRLGEWWNGPNADTTEEAGEWSSFDICGAITELLYKVPSKLIDGIKPIAKVAKEILPALMLGKAAWEVGKIVTTIVNTIYNYFAGKIKDPKEWLNLMIGQTGNPIHELVTIYTAYNIRVSQAKTGVDDTNEIRAQFYAKLVEAEEFATKAGHMIGFLDFKRKLTDAFNTPPRITERPFEPTVLVLSGAPGNGKSTFYKAIVAGEIIDPQTPKGKRMQALADVTYTWNSASEYQVGMSGKKIILFDDLQQDKGENDEIMALMHLATCAPFVINSPNITGYEIKGMTVTPHIVVACTNATYDLLGQDILDSEALLRRYDLELHLFDRFDPAKPDKAIAQVRSCVRYKKMIGKLLTLKQAQGLFAVVHRAKRADYKKVSKIVEEQMSPDIAEYMLGELPGSETRQGASCWQADEDLYNDYCRHVLGVDPAWKRQEERKGETREVPLRDAADYIAENIKIADPNIKVEPKNVRQAVNKSLPKTSPFDNSHLYTETEAGWLSTASLTSILNIASTMLVQGISLTMPLSLAQGFLATIDVLMLDASYFRQSRWKTMLSGWTKCFIKTIIASIATFAIFKIYMSDSESGTTKTAKPNRTIATVQEGGEKEKNTLSPLFRNATGYVVYGNVILNCVFVGGTYILVPRHFFLDLERQGLIPKDTLITIGKSNWNGREKTFLFDPKELRYLKGNVGPLGQVEGYRTDVCLYRLSPKEFTAEKRITQHFWRGDYDPTSMEVVKMDFLPYGDNTDKVSRFIDSTGFVTKDQITTGRTEKGMRTFHVLAEANYASRAASCGSLVRRPIQDRPLLGIHVARGVTNIGYFHYVTEQDLNNAMGEIIVPEENHLTVAEADYSYMPPKSILALEFNNPKPVFQPTKTDLTPSTVYEVFGPHTTEPSVLSGADPRVRISHEEFWRKMFDGFAVSEKGFSKKDLAIAAETMVQDMRIMDSNSKIKHKILNLHESINGLPIDDNTRLDMTTSAGWPYMPTKKTELFSVENDMIIPKPTIVADYDRAINNIEHGIIPFLPFALTVKDERLKLKKIADCRSRLFACANVIHFLISRRYFYTVLMQFYHARKGEMWCIPSLDRLSLDWHELATVMFEAGRDGFDFDFSLFDRTLSHLIIYTSVEILLTCVPCSDLAKRTLQELCASPWMVHRELIYRANGVNASGALLTFILNCTANELMHRAAYFYLATNFAPSFAEYKAYKKYVRGMRGGDDSITVVSDEIASWYNGVTVSKYLNARGMVVTSADKLNEIEELKPFMFLSFLKNKTGYVNGYYIPLPEIASLQESCHWIRLNRYNNDAVRATQDNCEASMRGMFFHGKNAFNEFRDKIINRDPRLKLPTYLELSNIWNKYYYFPGCHADYATNKIQNDDYRLDVQPHELASTITTVSFAMDIETTTESGKTGGDRISFGTVDEVYPATSGRAIDRAQTAEDTKTNTVVPAPSDSLEPEKVQNSTLGSTDKTETKTMGTTIQDSSQVSVKKLITGDHEINPRNARAHAYLNDSEWSLARLIEKFTFVKEVDWKITDVAGTVLMSLTIPEDILVTPAQKAPWDLTALARWGKVVFKVVVKPSPFYSGSLVQGFSPLDANNSYLEQINMGASIIKCSQDEGVEFHVPFRHYLNALSVPGDNVGKYVLTVQAPLRTASTNPNNITVALYVAIIGAEFKIPEVVPTSRYISHKFDKNTDKITFPESGKREETEQRSTVCNINDPLETMDSTMLCAGEGLVGRVKVPHFQDGPLDLIPLFKRWRNCGKYTFEIPADEVAILNIRYDNIRDVVLEPLASYFALWRGSLMFRARYRAHSGATSTEYPLDADISYFVFGENKDSADNRHLGRYDGLQIFDANTPAQIMLPYISRTFVEQLRIPDTDDKEVVIRIYNTSLSPAKIIIDFEAALGDDAHCGLFKGAAERFYGDNQTVFPTLKMQKIIYEKVITIPEAGILEFIDRAVDTALPIVEAVSVLGGCLDAHPITYQPYPVQQRRVPLGIATDLVNFKETLLATNHNGMSLPDIDCFGSDKSETSIYNLLIKTKSQIGSFTWDSSQPLGTPLYTINVGPAGIIGKGQLHDTLPQTFDYWNGLTSYIFDIVGTQQHRGQIMFTYTLAGTAPSYADSTQTYFTTFDLSSGRGTIRVDCPFLSKYPFLKVANERDPTPGTPYSPGVLRVFVQNALRSASTTSDKVDVIVYKTYGPDFRLGVFGSLASVPAPARKILTASGRVIPAKNKKQ